MTLPDPIVFVGGSERSGTTLTRNMLSAHPLLAIPNESPFMFSVHRELMQRGAERDTAAAWRLLRETSRFRQWKLPGEEVEELLASAPPATYADVLRTMFAAYARWHEKPHAGDKTTGNALRFTWLAERFPNSRFIHVLRDPREVCMSRVVQIFNDDGLVGAAHHWRQHVSAALGAAADLGDRLIELRYEDLLADPRGQLTRIGEFLGIGFDEAMLEYRWQRDVIPQHRFDVHPRQALRSDLRPWRTELSRDDVSVIESIAGEVMEAAGYRLELGVLTRRAAARIAAQRLSARRARWLERDLPKLRARWQRDAESESS